MLPLCCFFSSKSHDRLLSKITSSRAALPLVLLMLFASVLTSASPVPATGNNPPLEPLLHKRSPSITDEKEVCYPKSASDKIALLNDGQSKKGHTLKVMEMSIGNAIHHVGILPDTIDLMADDSASLCFNRSVVIDVPELFPGKVLVTECNTACSTLSSDEKLANDHLRVNVLRRDTTACDGKEERWNFDTVKIPQCRRFS